VSLVTGRYDDRIGHLRIDRPMRNRSGKAEIVKLHRRGTVRENPDTASLRVTLEVDEHVQCVAGYRRRCRFIIQVAQVAPMRKRLAQTLAHRAAVVAVERVGECRHPPAVVRLEQSRGQMRSRVLVEVIGEIAHAQRVASLAHERRGRIALRRTGHRPCGELANRASLQRRIVEKRRRHHR
jgi:hypothetical protein